MAFNLLQSIANTAKSLATKGTDIISSKQTYIAPSTTPNPSPAPQFKTVPNPFQLNQNFNISNSTPKTNAGVDTIGAIKNSASTLKTVVVTASKIAKDGPKQAFTKDSPLKQGLNQGMLGVVSNLNRANQSFYGLVGDKTGESIAREAADRDKKLATALAQQGVVVNDTRNFTQKLQDPDWFYRSLGQNIPQVLGSLGVGVATGGLGVVPAVAATTLFGGMQSYGSAYDDARAKGVDDTQAKKVATFTGIGNAALESVPGFRVINKLFGKKVTEQVRKTFAMNVMNRLVSVMKQGTAEGGTESLQTVYENAWKQTYDQHQKLFEGVPESAFFGTFLGGGTDVAVQTVQGGQKVLEGAKNLPNQQGGFARVPFAPDQTPAPYAGETDLSTKLLERLKGRANISKQFIIDLTKGADIKQAERDTILKALEGEGDVINVPNFAKKVKGELLPINAKFSDDVVSKGAYGTPRYSQVRLPVESRGDISNYRENIYESPIKTQAGDVHFSEDTDKYFAHSRIEDMADGQTRRVIEAQSDLFQKGRLDDENITLFDEYSPEDIAEMKKYDPLNYKAYENGLKRKAEIAKLEPYRNTWHERVIREEIKKAAQDGKTKLQFPTGETAMKIEGLGENSSFFTSTNRPGMEDMFDVPLKPETAKAGAEVWGNGQRWIITEVKGDGKFKAITLHNAFPNETGYLSADLGYKPVPNKPGYAYKAHDAEEFDISGKVDTNNPIYKFYESTVQKYLKKYGGKLVTDAQGVSWIEVPINKTMQDQPVLAFNRLDNSSINSNNNSYDKQHGREAGKSIDGIRRQGSGDNRLRSGTQPRLRIQDVLGTASTILDQEVSKEGGRRKSLQYVKENIANLSFADQRTLTEKVNKLLKTHLGKGDYTHAHYVEDILGVLQGAGLPQATADRFITLFTKMPQFLQTEFDGVFIMPEEHRKHAIGAASIGDGWNLTINPDHFNRDDYQDGHIIDHEIGGHIKFSYLEDAERKKVISSLNTLVNKYTDFMVDVVTSNNPGTLQETLYEYSQNPLQVLYREMTNEEGMGEARARNILANFNITVNEKLTENGIEYSFKSPRFSDLVQTIDLFNNIKKQIQSIIKVNNLPASKRLTKILTNDRSYIHNELYAKLTDHIAEGNKVPQGANSARVVESVFEIIEGTNPYLNTRDYIGESNLLFSKDFDKSLAALSVQLENAREMLNSHPAKALAKYANKNRELPEVLGRVNSNFGTRGDDIVTELGFSDSETARQSYEDYKKGKTRVEMLEQQYRAAKTKKNADIMGMITQGPRKLSAEGIPLALTKRERAIVGQQEITKSPRKSETNNFPKPESRLSETSAPLVNKRLTSEEQSLEMLGLQVSKSSGQRSGIKPLVNMVEEMQTPVKKKVGMLDYFRTPDRVLKKMGLGKLADLLRVQYDKYVKELPQNIQIITDWSKRVGPESSQRIFKWLDGQEITLTPKEQEVSLEIRTWLAQWADRLGLPEDKRVTNYITRLFEDQLIQKEFDEDLAKIIADKIPASVYDPFLQKRLGAKGYKEDVWAALDAYVKRATRKVHMDPALSKLEDAAGGLEESQWDYVKQLSDRINMRPTKWDNSIDITLKQTFGYRFGQRPINKISRVMRQITFRGMLGGNIGSALRNLSQGVNTFAKLGTRDTALGYIKLLSNGTKELKAEGILVDNFVQDRALNATKKTLEKLDKTLFVFFDAAEKINRGAAYYGAKTKYIRQGKTEIQAIALAKQVVRDTQFLYGPIDTPVSNLLSSDIGKLVTQFLTYPVKQTEFLAEMAKNKEMAGVLRYVFGGLGFVFTLGAMMGMEPDELVPWLGYFTGETKFGIPPSLKAPWEVAKAVADSPDKYGKDRDVKKKTKDVSQAFIGWIPGGIQGKKTYQGLKAVQEGSSVNAGGRKQFDVGGSPLKNAQAIIFGKYAGGAAKDYFNKLSGDTPKTEADKIIEAKKEQHKKDKARVNPVFIKVQGLINTGKPEEAQDIVDALSEEDYEIYKDLKKAYKTEQTKAGVKAMYPTAIRIMKLKENGQLDAAQAEVDALSDDEYELYKKAKDQLGYK